MSDSQGPVTEVSAQKDPAEQPLVGWVALAGAGPGPLLLVFMTGTGTGIVLGTAGSTIPA